jgi:hypothetical protein
MFKMGSHDPFGHLKHKLWSKERSGMTTKSRELTRFPCDLPLESSWQGLQLCFIPHRNRRSACKVMGPQSCKNPNCKTKCHLDVPPMERRKKYYKGESDGFPQVWVVVSLVNSSLPMVHLSTKSAQIMH